MRDRLIELINDSKIVYDRSDRTWTENAVKKLADFLLDNGVIVPPVKVGDKVYAVRTENIPDFYRMSWHEKTFVQPLKFRLSMIEEIGKTVFLAKEEAEQALSKLQASYKQARKEDEGNDKILL